MNVYSVACPGFVPLVEQMRYKDPIITNIVIHQTLKQWRNSDADTVILGCTHYPLLYQPIYEYFSGTKTVISSGLETAREVSALPHLAMSMPVTQNIPDIDFCDW